MSSTKASVQNRFHLIDAFRGVTILSMVAYHFCYDVFMSVGMDPTWVSRPAVYIWQQSICWSFIFLAGVSWHWGRSHNIKRGLVINFWGLVVSLVTLFVMPYAPIRWGVLTFTGCAILLTVPAHRLLQHIPAGAGLGASFVLFLLFKQVQRGWLGLFGHVLCKVPQALYSPLLTPFGFPYPGFVSSDYFPLLPWVLLFWCGYFAGRLFAACPALHGPARCSVPFLSWLGRHSLTVYVLHQPVCMAVCLLLFR